MKNSASHANWLNKNVLLISFSAFFADSGYQAIIAGVPLFLVMALKAPAYYFGFAMALGYGGGALTAYVGGRLSDRYRKKIIIISGNALITFLSFIGITRFPSVVLILFVLGWWSRNFRTPARRALFSGSVLEEKRGKAFGFLHALDIGGGLVSSIYFVILLYFHISFKYIFLVSFPLLIISTLLIFFVDENYRLPDYQDSGEKLAIKEAAELKEKLSEKYKQNTFFGILIATALYGFSSFSLGFPILTIAQRHGYIIGIAGYALLSIISSLTGLYIGGKMSSVIRNLSVFGYFAAAVGSLVIGYAYARNYGVLIFYSGAAVLGLSMGVIETLEPALISLLAKESDIGLKMGSLTAARSIGLFTGNIIMGALYTISPMSSYEYVAAVAVISGIIMLVMGRSYHFLPVTPI